MRIFFVVAASPNAIGLPGSGLWHANLKLPLIDLGHEVIDHPAHLEAFRSALDITQPAARAFVQRHRPEASQRLVEAVEKAHREKPIDLFFSYLYSAHVEPGAIRAIRDLGIPTMNWYCNGSYQFHLVEEIAPAFDWCLVPERFRLDDYRRVGARPIYCQEAANPNIYKPLDVPRDYDVTFVGQAYGNRPGYLKALIDAGVDARAWGPRWRNRYDGASLPMRLLGAAQARLGIGGHRLPLDRLGPPLSDDELVAMYSRSRIGLDFTTVAHQPPGQPAIRQVRLRDFEATCSGAFYLVEHFDELTDFFDPGREIVCFEGEADLVDKARYYLAHDDEREAIRQAGMTRARAEHTWHARFEQVFKEAGLT